jgi:putative hydrolase of the HAD superfamily
VVFFDVAGTLLRVRGSVGEQYAALARRFGIAAGADALDSGFGPAFRAASPMAFPGASPEAVPALERDWWRRLVRGLFEDVGFLNPDDAGRFDDYFAALYAHFATAAAWEVYADVRPLLRTLRERGCRTGVVTNFDGRIGPLLAEVGLAPWFDSVTVASEVGVAKPDPAIFRHALALHGAEPGEAIHVGDSPAEDVAGAAAAGLLPVLVDRGNRHAEVAAPGVRVTSLTEVACFLRIPE